MARRLCAPTHDHRRACSPRAAAIFVVSTLCTAAPAAGSEPDWARYRELTVDTLQRYLRLDTTNPPGNELAAARFLAGELERFGVRAQVFEIAPGRANLVAVLRGTSKKRPIVLTHHSDVVGADPNAWRHPPFSGALVAGEVWGRGALDMKATGIAHLILMRMFAERKDKLDRDLIYLMLADEEVDSTGATWMKENGGHLLRDAQYLLNEGATLVADGDTVQHVGVATMEKTVLWLRLSATGLAGHGSTPGDTGALDHLLAALGRLHASHRPIRVLPSVAAYFKGIAPRLPPELQPAAELRRHLNDAAFLSRLTTDPHHNAMLRDTVAITAVHAGDMPNIIPGTAEAKLDCRLLPGTDKGEFLTWLRRALGDDTVAVEEILYFATEESPIDTELMRSIRRVAKRMHPGVPVIPVPLTSTTDSSVFRAMGITAYGFEPWVLTDEQLLLTHGANERLSVRNIEHGLRFLYAVIDDLDR